MNKAAILRLNRVVEMIRWTDLHLPNFYFKLANGEMSPPDRKILTDPRVADLFIRNQEESMAGMHLTPVDTKCSILPYGGLPKEHA